ncbi:MBOAT family O-acyltransferase [Clostridium septicum]|uniref:MBOAT family protein n=1 Tax=Clostridium septicum TaxID=1504 RepID=A0A9N7PHP7_CLOSE|nr:MBOAT family O-acyltransferase [Clostridium septicum]AYE32981.1 transcriptional regulator [Clostridium septicum]QAS61151.1 MBOAT family protein [Clostridium septicum]UEC19503.1 MBOAT family protein [Clostridium septicum]USR99544.1 MBOAT family protein [Clostridium septicum]WLF68054.1 MBOAT family O-acyltransferase [Clostridium septicum]
MVFSSIVFIFRFLPLAVFIYFLTPKKYKNLAIFLLSLIFYSFGEPKYFPIIILSILIDFIVSNIIENNRDNKTLCNTMLTISIIFNLGLLIFFKYINFFIDNINFIFNIYIKNITLTLPLGISFYTFQTLSYTIDVYNKKIHAEKNIVDFGAFVALFPQLIAGPIVKYIDINNQIKNRKTSLEEIESGIQYFIIGLGKKVLIANNIGLLWDELNSLGFSNISTPLAWLGVLSFSLQIYFDFSGYSQMAIGIGKIFGFSLPNNFNYPYISRSMTEFWRRWHISLGSWFKEYVYIPLGGSRKSKKRTYFNLLIVWILTGFWHGAEYNFILWGIFFFILISIEKAGFINVLNNNKILSHIYVIIFLLIGFSIFSISNTAKLIEFLKRLFIFKGGLDYLYYLKNYGIILIIGCIFSMPIYKKINLKYKNIKTLKVIFMLIIFILSIAYLVDSSYNPFLYFRF